MLTEDVKVLFNDEIEPCTHLKINSGIYFASDKSSACGKYLYNGYLPVPDWRPLNFGEKNILTSNVDIKNRVSTISTGKISKELFDYSRFIGVHELSSLDDTTAFTKSGIYEAFRRKIFDFFYDYIETPENLCMLKLSCQCAALEVSTFNTDTQRLLGLHFDSWNPLDSLQRNLSRNRMCINFGKEPRDFIFINLTLPTMIKKSKIDIKKIKENNDILHIFFSRFPKYSVKKLTINPGQYYIAPTENIPHDGSTAGKIHPDIFLTILGYFKVKHGS